MDFAVKMRAKSVSRVAKRAVEPRRSVSMSAIKGLFKRRFSARESARMQGSKRPLLWRYSRPRVSGKRCSALPLPFLDEIEECDWLELRVPPWKKSSMMRQDSIVEGTRPTSV